MIHTVAIDSHMLSYLLDATSPAFDPATDSSVQLVEQKVALLRCIFYWDGVWQLIPTVLKEYQRIADSARKERHDVLGMVLFEDEIDLDSGKVAALRSHYLEFHPDPDDCQIVAEAKLAGADLLLTCDKDLRRHLGTKVSTLQLMDAQELWVSLGIPQGAPLRIQPRECNSLSRKTWWHW